MTALQSTPAARAPTAARRAGHALRRHWPFVLLLAAGAALRVVTQLAYRPALLYQDSLYYLRNAEHLVPMQRKPVLYPAFLRILPIDHELAVVPLVQHVMALAVAVILYALLRRLGVNRWLATAAAAPLVLDAFQLLIEQHVLSETLFEVLLIGACAALMWRRPAPVAALAAAGLLLGLAGLTRLIALVLIAPMALYVLLAPGRASRALALLAVFAGFAAPLGAYALWYHADHGRLALAGGGGRLLYARVAPFAQCSKVQVPADERPLCPRAPVADRPSPQEFAWAKDSPWYRLPQPRREPLAGDFARRIIRGQPVDYADAVVANVIEGFRWKRSMPRRRITFDELWTFQPVFPRERRYEPVIRAHGDLHGYVKPGLVRILRAYQRFGFTPGPLLALGALAGLLAALGLGRARRSAARWPALLFATLGLALAFGPALTHQLTPRYLLPAIMMLPAALVLAIVAITGRGGERAPR